MPNFALVFGTFDLHFFQIWAFVQMALIKAVSILAYTLLPSFTTHANQHTNPPELVNGQWLNAGCFDLWSRSVATFCSTHWPLCSVVINRSSYKRLDHKGRFGPKIIKRLKQQLLKSGFLCVFQDFTEHNDPYCMNVGPMFFTLP